MSQSVDVNHERNIIKKLQNLGLSEKEARVYVALLPRPETGTAALISATGLHGQFVYDALEKLQGMGLARHAVVRGRKKFSANPPEQILSLLRQKELEASELVRELEKRFAAPLLQRFEVYQGHHSVVAHELHLLEEAPEGSRVDILGAGGEEYIKMLDGSFEGYEKRRVQKKINIRYLSTAGSAGFLGSTALRTLYKYSTFPGMARGFVETSIWSDKIVLILFGDPVTSFVFRNEKVAAGYREFFEMLWNIRPN
ncbi:MAG: TrmB family transcriptional regulator [Minisyncoccia bacterium]